MLPRIAKLDQAFARAIRFYIRTRSRGSPVLNRIASHIIHEGRSNVIQRSPVDSEPTEMMEASAETKIGFDEIESVDESYVLQKANDIADQFERHFSKHLFKTLDEVTKKTGLRHSGGGQPLTNDMVIETLSKMNINFEKSASGDIEFITSPEMAGVFAKLDQEMATNPELQIRWNEMMDKKRDEFRTREINRNLAG